MAKLVMNNDEGMKRRWSAATLVIVTVKLTTLHSGQKVYITCCGRQEKLFIEV